MSIGKKIQILREEKDLTQKELANKVGLNTSVMNRIELGERPARDDEIIKIADVLEVTTDYLLGRTNSPTGKHNYITSEDRVFESPEEAMDFILQQKVIMGFGGFDIDTLSDSEKVDFANELLQQLKLLSYKYKK